MALDRLRRVQCAGGPAGRAAAAAAAPRPQHVRGRGVDRLGAILQAVFLAGLAGGGSEPFFVAGSRARKPPILHAAWFPADLIHFVPHPACRRRVVLVRHGQSTWNARNRIQVGGAIHVSMAGRILWIRQVA